MNKYKYVLYTYSPVYSNWEMRVWDSWCDDMSTPWESYMQEKFARIHAYPIKVDGIMTAIGFNNSQYYSLFLMGAVNA